MMARLKRFWGRINGRYASTGSANSYVLTPDVALVAYVTGERYSFRANFANTGSADLNISGLGAKTIKKMAGTATAALSGGEIQNGQSVTVEYDGADLLLLSPLPTATQTQMEAASSAGHLVTAAVLKYHPHVPKALGTWGDNGAAVGTFLGISSVTDTGTGDQTVNFSTNFSSANYTIGSSQSAKTGVLYWANRAVGSVQMLGRNFADSANVDLHPVGIQIWGDHA